MTLGELFKKTREDSGFSLEKAAELSKTQAKYIERLEKDEYDKLPAPVYMRGFLKKYAKILELEESEILARYQKTLKQRDLQRLPALRSPKIIITPKMISLLILAIVVAIIAGYLIYQLDFLIAPPQLSLDYPSEDLTTSRSTIEVFGRSDQSAKLTINGQQVYIDKEGKFSQEINLSTGLNILLIEAVNRFGKKSEITRQIILTSEGNVP